LYSLAIKIASLNSVSSMVDCAINVNVCPVFWHYIQTIEDFITVHDEVYRQYLNIKKYVKILIWKYLKNQKLFGGI